MHPHGKIVTSIVRLVRWQLELYDKSQPPIFSAVGSGSPRCRLTGFPGAVKMVLAITSPTAASV